MSRKTDPYEDFVEHPRFGKRPHLTGLNPRSNDEDVYLHWNTRSSDEVAEQYEAVLGEPWPYGGLTGYSKNTQRIPNTAVRADLDRQTPATVPVTHYFDLARTCRDCGQRFIFFAKEQKYWYEELGFGLDSDGVRCVPCRKNQQGLARAKATYDALFPLEDRDEVANLKMADACLALIEGGVFPLRQVENVRRLLNLIPKGSNTRVRPTYRALDARARKVMLDRKTS